MSSAVRPAPPYIPLLGQIHAHLRPRTYVEIGVQKGQSLAQAARTTEAIGIDPNPRIRASISCSFRLFELESDAFFAKYDLGKLLGGPVDLAFIDGMHLFEFVLRDFANLERFAGPDSAILIHDCKPRDARTASRDRTTWFWTGDVWRLLPCLSEYRPDLSLAIVDIAPSGLGLVTRLDPSSTVLRDAYGEIRERLVDVPYEASKHTEPYLVDASWETVRSLLPGP